MDHSYIKTWGDKGGPVPNRSNSIQSAFWRAYVLGPNQPGLRGGSPDSPAGVAFKAGLRRRKVEPGLLIPK